MRVAVIGCGSIGKRHLANLRGSGHTAIAVDVSAETRDWARLAGYEANGYKSEVELPPHIHAAVIATPAAWHLSWLRQCVARNLPVLIEKPLGAVSDLPALRDLRPSAPIMVGYQLRFHPAIRRIKPALSKTAAGILQCRCDSRTWPGSAAHGDFLAEFSHELDLARHLGAHGPAGFTTRDDHTVHIGMGAFAVVLADRSDGYLRRWEIFDQPYGSYDVQYRSADEYGKDATVMYRDELAHFLRAVEGGPIAPGCTLEEGIAVLEVVETAKRMAQGVIE